MPIRPRRKYKLPPIRCVPGTGPLYAHDPPVRPRWERGGEGGKESTVSSASALGSPAHGGLGARRRQWEGVARSPLAGAAAQKFLVPASGELNGAVTEADARNWALGAQDAPSPPPGGGNPKEGIRKHTTLKCLLPTACFRHVFLTNTY